MNYRFEEETFIKTFKVDKDKGENELRLKNEHKKFFKLFPYTTHKDDIDLNDIVCGFFRKVFNIAPKNETELELENFITKIEEKVDTKENTDLFETMIKKIFFDKNNFKANNITLYPYQKIKNIKFADFLFSVFEIKKEDCDEIKRKVEKCNLNLIEEEVYNVLKENEEEDSREKESYVPIQQNIQKKFKEDLYYMIDVDMTSMEDFTNLFSLYYFYYISQTCITLDSFCRGNRDKNTELYFSLDLEKKVSKNRQCCKSGFKILQSHIENMFIHAITLEILNQKENKEPWDYIKFGEYIKENPEEDKSIADQIERAEGTYKEYIEANIHEKLDKIPQKTLETHTERAIQHLYECVKKQFSESKETTRSSAPKKYCESYTDFCKKRWVRDRGRAGSVLNLTESDIIFLTKIALHGEEKILLKDLYKEYEERGIYLDSQSKECLQEFLISLNLMDQKSDSGDAQYVKRIL